MTVERVDVIVEGRVQGVGYRDFCVRSADRLGVVGYAANLEDGSVRVVGEGPRVALEALVRELQQGPRLARVTSTRVTWQASSGEFTRFGIRYGGRGA